MDSLKFWIRIALDAARLLYDVLHDHSTRFVKNGQDQNDEDRHQARSRSSKKF